MKRTSCVAVWGLSILIPTIAASQSTTTGTQTTGTSGTQSGTQTTGTSGTQSGTQTTGTSGTQSGTQTTGTSGTQTTGTQSGTQTSGTQTSGTSGTQTSGASGTQTSTDDQSGTTGGWMGGDSEWLASAFVGSSFGAEDAEDAALDFGGSFGYLWRGALGAEFLANFSPDFSLDPTRSALLTSEEPWINTYMFNAMAAIPIGTTTRFQPYVSGGFGAITLRADTLLTSNGNGNDFAADDTRGAGNLGLGFMTHLGRAGLRADLRWFRAFDAGDGADDPNQTNAEIIGRAVLADLSFWRANIGLAFRF